jgi:hypothetical protein
MGVDVRGERVLVRGDVVDERASLSGFLNSASVGEGRRVELGEVMLVGPCGVSRTELGVVIDEPGR